MDREIKAVVETVTNEWVRLVTDDEQEVWLERESLPHGLTLGTVVCLQESEDGEWEFTGTLPDETEARLEQSRTLREKLKNK